MRRRLGWILFSVYVLFLLWLTIFSREPRVGDRIIKWQFLWAYRAWIAGAPNGKTESIQNINNVLVFIPFGALFPLRRRRVVLPAALLFSNAIEAVQYAFNLGWCELDDVISNTLGAMIGFGLVLMTQRWRSKWKEF